MTNIIIYQMFFISNGVVMILTKILKNFFSNGLTRVEKKMRCLAISIF